MDARWVVTVALVAMLSACGGATGSAPTTRAPAAIEAPLRVTPRPPPAPIGPSLRFDVEPDDAEVVVDGEVVGVAADIEAAGPYAIDAGLHQIMISRDGFHTWRAEVAVKDQPEPIEVKLEPKLD